MRGEFHFKTPLTNMNLLVLWFCGHSEHHISEFYQSVIDTYSARLHEWKTLWRSSFH